MCVRPPVGVRAEAEEGREVEISVVQKASEALKEMKLMKLTVDSVSLGQGSLACL